MAEGKLALLSSFCRPENYDPFGNALGEFTPCFTEVYALGLAHVVGLALVPLRARAVLSRADPRLALSGLHLLVQLVVVACCAMAALIPLMQLNGRLGGVESHFGTADAKLPPAEVVSYVLAVVVWALCTAVAALELARGLVWRHGWTVRFVCLFVFAGHCAKLHFVLELPVAHQYFFWLYVVQFGCHGVLALVALLHHPRVPRPVARSDVPLVPPSGVRDFELLQDDDNQEEPANVIPEFRCNVLSQISFGWMTPLLEAGSKKPLELDDIWGLEAFDRNQNLTRRLERELDRERAKPEPSRSLLRALVRCWGWEFARGMLWKLLNDLSQFVGPVFLKLLLESISHHESWSVGYAYAACIFAGQLVGMLGENVYFQKVMRVGFQLRSALVTCIFRSSLSSPPAATATATAGAAPSAGASLSIGKLNNLVTSDCEALQQICTRLANVWSAPFRIITCMAMLYQELGAAALVALVVLTLMVPVQSKVVRWAKDATRSTLKQTDERVKVTREVIAGMDVVKLYGWEDSFLSKINGIRGVELTWLRKNNVLMALNSFVVGTIPILVSVLTFLAYAWLGNTLTAAKAFTSLTLFSVLRFPLFVVPDLVVALANTSVSLQRLQDVVLGAPGNADANAHAADGADEGKGDSDVAIEIDGTSFSWQGAEGAPSLSEIRLRINKGALVAVVGATGSGKSTLVSAMLGELAAVHSARSSGKPAVVRGKVAYVPQQAWLFNGTIRENITFSRAFDESQFAHAVRCASLQRDLDMQPAGEFTEIGEKGVNMSGGQRQRISIARAVYSQGDVVLFDDPLSALDAKVGRHVFDECIVDALRGKTRVVVTNQMQHLPKCDHIVFLHGGAIVAQGSYSELMENSDFRVFRGQSEVQVEEAEEEGEGGEEKGEEGAEAGEGKAAPSSQAAAPPTPANAKSGANKGKDDNRASVEGGKLVQAEHRESGLVDQRVVWHYVRAMGGTSKFVVLMASYLLTEVLRLLTSWWMAVWTDSMEDPSTAHSLSFYILVFSLFSLAQVLVLLFSQLCIALFSFRAATSLHVQMLSCILRAPMSFFHTNPLGRVLNRFSKDQADIDRSLASSTSMFLRGMGQLLSTLVLISAVTPFTSTAFIPLLMVFVWLFSFFQRSAREVKRLDSLTRSPVYSFFNQALSGGSSVRAYGAEQQMVDKLALQMDQHIALNLVSMSMNRWLSVRLEVLGSLMILASAVFAVVQQGSASDTGLSLSYALGITGLLTMTIRLGSMAENSFNAVERVMEYTEVQSEAPPVIDNHRPPNDWPSEGAIKFENVWMSYRPALPPVLKGLSVDIDGGHRIGICGRTGAGKSTVFNALFRIVEVSQGKVVVDGHDLAQYGLLDVRRKLSIIPQDPVLFSGSLRDNLDPFHECSDAQVWEALKQAHLGDLVDRLPDRLHAQVVEGGDNFSVGQRQLICLARALLRRSPILVLDEATANVDVQTDALIQQTIQSAFKNCTMLIIAHRLNTIIDCDRILVLDAGKAVEFGSPKELLSNADGIFTSLVNDTGPAMAAHLRNIAFGLSAKPELQPGAVRKCVTRANSMTIAQSALARVRAAHATLRKALQGRDQDVERELVEDGVAPETWRTELFQMVGGLVSIMRSRMQDEGLGQDDEVTDFGMAYTR